MFLEFSENKKNLTLALLDFNKKIDPIFRNQTAKIKMKTGGEMQYRFTDLASIQGEINGILSECGLVVIQSPIEKFKLETVIIHAESGEYMAGCYEMIPAGNNPQAHGSVITYQKRYALIAMLNLIIKDDDDAKKGSERGSREQLAKKHFKKTSKDLASDMGKHDFYKRLHAAELAVLQERGAFNLRGFLGELYDYTTSTVNEVEEAYWEYKINNNIN